MTIDNIRIQETETTISLLADCKVRPYAKDHVYFTFDKRYRHDLVLDGSPLAAAFLIPAMRQGEDLTIDAPVSEKLLAGMHTLMNTIADWKWEVPMRRVKIIPKEVIKDTPPYGEKVATFFSGGVDSFYTFLKHRKDERGPITHFILIKGADIESDNEELWQLTLANVREVAEKSNITLVVAETNFQSFMEPMMDQGLTHGGLLAAVGLCMRRSFKKIYIPATFSYDQNILWGTHPKIDHLWNVEGLTFEHDGAEATRFQKVEWQIAKSPLALEHLRVCYLNVKGKYNCGHCEKCYRTMLELAAIDMLNDAKTFPHEFDLKLVEEAASESGFMYITYEEILRPMAAKKIYPEVQEAIRKGLARNDRSHMENHGVRAKAMIRWDHLYLHGILRGLYRRLK